MLATLWYAYPLPRRPSYRAVSSSPLFIGFHDQYIYIVHYEENWIQWNAQTPTIFSSLPSYHVILSWFIRLYWFVYNIIWYVSKKITKYWNGKYQKLYKQNIVPFSWRASVRDARASVRPWRPSVRDARASLSFFSIPLT